MIDIYEPTTALWVVFGVSVLLSLSYIFLNKKFIYTPDYTRKKSIIDQWKREYGEARKKKDSRHVKRLEKKQDQIRKLESQLAMKTMKLFVITTIPFWLVFYLLSQNFSSLGQFLILPLSFPLIGGKMNFFWWYLICSFTFSNILRKIFKVG